MRKGPTLTGLPLDIYDSVLSTTATASLARATSYDQWGAPTGTNTAEPRLGYRGELNLDTLLHLHARDNNPPTGQFTTRDPIDGRTGSPTVANPYHYTDNNPPNHTDPTGLLVSDANLGAASARQRFFIVPRIPGGGRVRVGQFIREAVVNQLGVPLGAGDNRSFNPSMVDRDNRVYLEVDFESGHGRLFYNYSCDPTGHPCYDAISPDGTSSIQSFRRGVSVKYTIGNSVAQTRDDRCNAEGLNCTALELGTVFKISAQFSIVSNGWAVCVSGHHSRFPSHRNLL